MIVKNISTSMVYIFDLQGNDYTFISMEDSCVTFESTVQLDPIIYLWYAVFDFSTYTYNEYGPIKSTLIDEKKQMFSWVCKVKIPQKDADVISGYLCSSQKILLGNASVDEFRNKVDIVYLKYIESLQKSKEENNYSHERIKGVLTAVEFAVAIDERDFCNMNDMINVESYIASKMDLLDAPVLKSVVRNINRVYIGNEFCDHRLPKAEEIDRILSLITEQGYFVSLVLPYVRQGKIKDIYTLISKVQRWAEKNNTSIEVVFNDWGVLKYINSSCSGIVPVMGRLLNRSKKDPRKKDKYGYERYKECNTGSITPEIIHYVLREQNVQRIEYDNESLLHEAPSKRKSLHIPFYHISTSLYCPLEAQIRRGNKLDQRPIKDCPHFCKYYYFFFKDSSLIGDGNSLFYIDKQWLFSFAPYASLADSGVDRIVISIPRKSNGIKSRG